MASRWTGDRRNLRHCNRFAGMVYSHDMGQQHRRGDFTEVSFRVIDQPPNQITWESQEIALPSNESAVINPYYSGPPIESWEVSPALPSGLQLSDDGTIEGVPDSRTDWSEYTIWGNNSGGSSSSSIWIAVHDLFADQDDLLRGMGQTNWGDGHLRSSQ